MTAPLLTNLANIPSVSGAAIFDHHGTCLEYELAPPYELILLESVRETLDSTRGFVSTLDGSAKPQTFIGRYQHGLLFARWDESFVILLMAAANANVPLLTVGLNAAALKMKAALSDSMSDSSLASMSDSHPAMSAQHQMMSSSQTGGSVNYSVTGQSRVPVPGAVGVPVIKQLIKLLAHHIGPVARVIVKRELRGLGTNAVSLMPTQYGDLVSLSGRSIADPVRRKAFIGAANELTAGF